MPKRKIRPVILGVTRATTKPKDVSQEEWDVYAEARRISKEQEGKPHLFAIAHRMLERNRRKRQEALRKRITIGGG